MFFSWTKGLTQMQAAETIGLPQPKLARLLNGHFRGVSVSEMMELCVKISQKRIESFEDYMADESRVSPELREKIKCKVELFKKRLKL